MAEKYLYNPEEIQKHVRPTLDLLIECKQSELPYIFFLDNEGTYQYNFPVISGLLHDNVCVSSNDTISEYIFPFDSLLGMDKHKFITQEPQFCLSFSKCTRKGKDLELSGTEAYNGLILPLTKAVDSFKKTKMPPRTAYYFDIHLTIPIGIVNAPMIGVNISYAIDIVHSDYLETYINRHLLPFANEFSEKLIRHQHIIATGEGYVKEIEKNHSNIESRLDKKPTIPKGNRGLLFIKNIRNNIIDIKKLN